MQRLVEFENERVRNVEVYAMKMKNEVLGTIDASLRSRGGVLYQAGACRDFYGKELLEALLLRLAYRSN